MTSERPTPSATHTGVRRESVGGRRRETGSQFSGPTRGVGRSAGAISTPVHLVRPERWARTPRCPGEPGEAAAPSLDDSERLPPGARGGPVGAVAGSDTGEAAPACPTCPACPTGTVTLCGQDNRAAPRLSASLHAASSRVGTKLCLAPGPPAERGRSPIGGRSPREANGSPAADFPDCVFGGNCRGGRSEG